MKKIKPALSIMLLLGLILALSSCKPKSTQSNETHSDSLLVSAEFIDKLFPILNFPVKIDPTQTTGHLLKGKDRERFSPKFATEIELYAIGQVDLFSGKTTLIYLEDFEDTDYYIVTYSDGRFSLEGAQLLPISTLLDGVERGPSDAWTLGTLFADGKLIIEQTSDGEKFQKVAEYTYTARNELLPFKQ